MQISETWARYKKKLKINLAIIFDEFVNEIMEQRK